MLKRPAEAVNTNFKVTGLSHWLESNQSLQLQRRTFLPPSFNKIFEKCLHNQLYFFLNKHNLINPNQFDFRANCSTSQAVSQLCEEYITNLDNKETTCSIVLDPAKAFDTVNHQKLIAKLEKYGVRDFPQQLIKSYLTNKKQCTVVNGTKSKPLNCRYLWGPPRLNTRPLVILNICQRSTRSISISNKIICR